MPGAESVDNLPPGAMPATSADPVRVDSDEGLSKAALKNKKKREAKRAKDAEVKAQSLAPPQESDLNLTDRRSPE